MQFGCSVIASGAFGSRVDTAINAFEQKFRYKLLPFNCPPLNLLIAHFVATGPDQFDDSRWYAGTNAFTWRKDVLGGGRINILAVAVPISEVEAASMSNDELEAWVQQRFCDELCTLKPGRRPKQFDFERLRDQISNF